jgi:hypothetical protein
VEIPKFNHVEHYRNLSDFLMAQYHLSTTYNHRGSKGLIREKILVDTLQSISNDYVLLTKGEVCDSTGRRSPEFDVIVSHRSSALRLFSSASHTVVPIETVLGVIEVKTKLSEEAVQTFNKSIVTVNSFERFFKPTAMYQQFGAITGNNEFQSFAGKPLKPTDNLLGLERIVGGIFAFESDSIDAVKGFLDRFQPEVNFGFVCVLNQFIALSNGQKNGWIYSVLGPDTFSGFATIFNELVCSIGEREQHLVPDSFRYLQFAASSIPFKQSG